MITVSHPLAMMVVDGRPLLRRVRLAFEEVVGVLGRRNNRMAVGGAVAEPREVAGGS